MNTSQVLSFIRTVLNFLGGIVVSWGWLDASGLTQAVGVIMTIVAAVWGWYTHTTVVVPQFNAPGTTTTAPIEPPEKDSA